MIDATGGPPRARPPRARVSSVFTEPLQAARQSLPAFSVGAAIVLPGLSFRSPESRETRVDWVFVGAFLALLLLTFALVAGCAALERRK